ncbi:MAG: TerC family protein [Opitutae bacterium]|jgi:predicted tellurium resistance membrane protein TerC|nr:TerC family protein [Opitutae bacterium]
MEIFLQPEAWIALLTLTFLEIVLGIDNIIFISIVSNKLPEAQQPKARSIGLVLALFVRILMLSGISYIIGFTQPLFEVFEHQVSGRDMILAIGGLFLVAKSITEIHDKVEKDEIELSGDKKPATFKNVLVQIVLLDIIFSFDSILTAVGMSGDLIIMISAVVISIFIMMAFATPISKFINKYPTLQMLALSFLILIGFMLILESVHFEVPKGYIYFAVFFSLLVEFLNIQSRKKRRKKST